ncbi:1-deoxy-D-xylulose-5-phosphate synthase [Ruminococcaceae bacterium R-25]|nr:1-deoxy-D-xylulose-5-phosphate synthase [Ruminococcaceae bacterium R-25]SUQ11084.1 1-deoxy-D-xylulose-5-phosphate synthase [Oscillospiraceae bacterium]
MDYKYLGKDTTPETLKAMKPEEREQLCLELRDKILNTVSSNGGHLASNLGAVELTVALLSVFDYKQDKIVFDVGHQAYSYKLLTGRFDRFNTLRQKDGISGFPRITESPYDAFDTGHSSTSISAAMGIARARDLEGKKFNVVSIIGDGALTGGLAYEAINDLGHSKTRMIIILNDNEMSIDKNVGGLSKHLSKLRISSGYISAKQTTESFLKKLGFVGRGLIKIILAIKDFFRFLLYRKTPSMFDDLGLNYYGPVDGHNMRDLIKAFDGAKEIRGPVLIHVITKKGKGYEPAETNPSDYHGVGPFNLETGVGASKTSYTTVFANTMTELAAKNPKIVAISAAMTLGTGLDNFQMKYPARFFDCGIAEEHSVTMAGGLAVSGYIPVVAIYSSFLQRAYDEMITDCCFMNSHVVFAIDRAGFVGNDGHTHHGLLDISYLNSMVNMTVLSPRDYTDLKRCLTYAVETVKGPVAIRYPRGASPFEANGPLYTELEDITKPHVVCDYGNDFALISTGKICEEADLAMELLKEQGIMGKHINLTLIKPLPAKEIWDLLVGIKYVFSLEEGIISGGFGESLERELQILGFEKDVTVFGVRNPIVRAMTQKDQLKYCGLDGVTVASSIKSALLR